VKKNNYLHGKNILVTGGDGFIGSHLVKKLLTLNASVFVPQRRNNPHSFFNTEKLYKKVHLVHLDVKNKDRVYDVVTKHEIDFIFHLAAQPIVTTAYHNPLETLETNIMGTANILEAARNYGKVRGVIMASSDKAYGKLFKDEYTETDPLKGDHPYEVSKSCADLIGQTYFKTYGLPVVITRFGNIYGPGDLNFNRIIPGMMKALIKNETWEIRSDGTFVRDYVYVEDVVSAYLFLAERINSLKGEAFNVSSGVSFSVLELLHKTEKVLHKKIKFQINNNAKNEIPFQHLDFTKIKKLGWKSKIKTEIGLRKTYLWYEKNLF